MNIVFSKLGQEGYIITLIFMVLISFFFKSFVKNFKWVTCHNLLYKTIMMHIFPNYKHALQQKVSLYAK